MKFTTRTGDSGTTDIMNERVDKCCDIIELLGTLDETASILAVARSLSQEKKWAEELGCIIAFIIRLAGSISQKEICPSDKEVLQLEAWIQYYESKAPDIKLFEYPSNKVSAVIDYARCVARRAERCAARLKTDIRYLNRLSDYLFVLSRYVEYGE